jgi:diguanylate cyclase
MYTVISCLTDQHDHRLVILAVVICALATFTAFYIYRSARQHPGPKRLGWVVLAGVATGAGIWATHFVAMLAFKTGLPTAYDPTLTAASLLVAIIVTTTGLLIAVQYRSKWWAAAGGAVIGLGIASMHYVGMRAYSVMGTVEWDPVLVSASIVLGVVFASGALVAFHASAKQWAVLSGAALLTIAICALHFTAMGAAVLTPDPTVIVYPSLFDNSTMALAVTGVSFLVILAALGAARIDIETAREAAARLRELADAAAEGIIIANDGVIVNVNQRFAELAEQPQDDLLGKKIFGDLLMGDRQARRVAAGGLIEAVLLTGSGRGVPVEVISKPYTSDAHANEVYAIRDLQERREAESKIRRLAFYDPLTGVANRSALIGRLEQCVTEANAENLTPAVLCVDLDQFNEINDVHGHDAGDRVLSTAADRLLRVLKSGEFLGRVSGDEFVVVQSDGPQPAAASALAQRLREALNAPLDINGGPGVIGATIGIALYPENGDTGQKLLLNADMALYRAKATERGGVCFFEPDTDLSVRRRRRLLQDLRVAVAEQQLEVYYQPQVRLSTTELLGFEALVRWHHPEHGAVPSNEFITLAEESGLVTPIAEWALKSACTQATTWPRPYRVSLNVSARQLKQTDYSSVVHRILLETELCPARLELEITETALFEDLECAVQTLRCLRALGVSIAMDDFGTGYSSLSSLQSFPFNKIKIARDLVKHIGERRQVDLIIKSIVGLGKSMDIPVLAEGVESHGQLMFLRSLDCQEAQGHYFDRPGSAEDILPLLARGIVEPMPTAPDLAALDPNSNVTSIAGARKNRTIIGDPSAA